MITWMDEVRRKVQAIQEEIAVLHAICEPESELFVEMRNSYIETVHKIYCDDFALAHLLDTSQLVAHFTGPSVRPTASLVGTVCRDLNKYILGIANSLFGLHDDADKAIRWPDELLPRISGIVPESLILGVKIGTSITNGQSNLNYCPNRYTH